jgi:hypothetical protein|nr:hypothetical protein [uncultured Prevotella sp.]
MIVNEVNKFMALAPLILPKLIDSKKCLEPDITDDSAILYFNLEEHFPIGVVMDMLEDDMELLLLYHGTKKDTPKVHHCCLFNSPKAGHSMYKINVTTNNKEFVEGISVSIFDSIDVWEDELESDLTSHNVSFDFIQSITHQELLSTFCKLGYET